MVCVEVVAPITGKVSSVVKASGRSSTLSDDIETRQRRPAKSKLYTSQPFYSSGRQLLIPLQMATMKRGGGGGGDDNLTPQQISEILRRDNKKARTINRFLEAREISVKRQRVSDAAMNAYNRPPPLKIDDKDEEDPAFATMDLMRNRAVRHDSGHHNYDRDRIWYEGELDDNDTNWKPSEMSDSERSRYYDNWNFYTSHWNFYP